MITGDLVHMKLDGEVLVATLGVVTGSLGDNNFKVLWLDEASTGTEQKYQASGLQAMNDEQWQETLFEGW
jgi:hypothetical protein